MVHASYIPHARCEYNAWPLHPMQGGALDHLSFRRRIAIAILEGNQRKFAKRSGPSSLEKADSRYNRIDYLIVMQKKQTRCRHCHKKVSTKREKCNVALHVACFKSYHVRDYMCLLDNNLRTIVRYIYVFKILIQ
nr:unnamed protein product [Callosobruchus chinensis]